MLIDENEWPRIHRLKANCCDADIIRFDLPSRCAVMLAQDALRYGWVLTRDGQWLCDEHKGNYA